MLEIYICSDVNDCRDLWRHFIPPQCVFDDWDVRSCFQRHYQNTLSFFVACRGGAPIGLLPLSWIEESGCYGYFPGETWQGRTWLEQNRIPADCPSTRRELLRTCPLGARLRYLTEDSLEGTNQATLDETGYLFHPGRYGFDLTRYWQRFSRKSRSRLRRDVSRFEKMGLRYRLDHFPDTDWLFRANLWMFGVRSYFHDPRFLKAFQDLLQVLENRGWLRITGVLVGQRLAAVDVGALVGGEYTLLAGATDPEFPGIAKVINLFHLTRACRRKLEVLDFLCGDFGWKSRFHLEPRPLFEWQSVQPSPSQHPDGVAHGVP